MIKFRSEGALTLKVNAKAMSLLRKSNALCIMNGDKDQRNFSRSFSVKVDLHVTSTFAFFFASCSPVLEIANIECEHAATDHILDFKANATQTLRMNKA